MQYVTLGTTGFKVSRIGLGTASFGLERYGIPIPGEGFVDSVSAIKIVSLAAEAGINLFDTAPGYGRSEELLGQGLASYKDCIIATKVPIPAGIASIPYKELERIVDASLDASRRALRRDVLDIVQIHNATIPMLREGKLLDCLELARASGKLKWIGASVYGPETALAAIETGRIQVLQLAMNLLDQRMRGRVLPEATRHGTGILMRSALLKGALTRRALWLPENLRPVAEASASAVKRLETTWEELPTMALRFCLSLPVTQTVLVGVSRGSELQDSLAAEAAGALPEALFMAAHSLALNDEQLLNPSYWHLEESDLDTRGP